jgi:hypothetical protein
MYHTSIYQSQGDKDKIMARQKRLKLKYEEGFFHIMSRTVGQGFYLGDVEKEKLFKFLPTMRLLCLISSSPGDNAAS